MAKRRPSGDGMVRKREDGRWEGRIVVGHKNNGEPIYRYVLAKRKENAVSDWIFPNWHNPEEPMNPQSAYSRLKVLLKKAELPLIRFHDLRHTFATHAIAGGVDAKTLSGILGHTNASFTLDTYTHVTTDMQKNAAKIVGNFMDDIIGGMKLG